VSLVCKILQKEIYQINVNVKLAFFRMEMNVKVKKKITIEIKLIKIIAFKNF
jgi:hypothetical protein